MPASVKAASIISQSFTISPITVGASQHFADSTTNLFPSFDPALGTLESARVELIFATTFTGAASGTNNSGEVVFHLDNGFPLFGATLDSNSYSVRGFVGEAPITIEANQQWTDPNDLLAFISPTPIGVVFTGVNDDRTTAINFTFQTESITYTYTEAVTATPEPASFAMFGGGLILVGLIGRSATRTGK